MALNLVSPGVKVREVDLTVGRIDPANNQVAGFAGPFQKGPVNQPTLVETEQELLSVFGKPLEKDGQNEYWLSASTYLSYGGVLRIVRAADINLRNSNVGVSQTSVSLQIDNLDDYQNNHSNDTGWVFASKTPGNWANGLKVCTIDNFADQTITGIGTTGVTTVTVTPIVTKTGNIGVSTNIITGITTSLLQVGYYVSNANFSTDNVTIQSIGAGSVTVNATTLNTSPLTSQSFDIEERISSFTPRDVQVGYAVTQDVTVQVANTNGTVSTFNGYIRGLITGIGKEEIHVRIVDRVNTDTDTVEKIDYKKPGSEANSYSLFGGGNGLNIVSSTGTLKASQITASSIVDWYDQQKLKLNNSTIYWNSIAEKPKTSQYGAERNAKHDEIHIAVVDDDGSISGTVGQILEKHTFLSKAIDGKATPSQSTYYKQYLANNSAYIYAGYQPSGLVAGDYNGTLNTIATKNSNWGLTAQSNSFGVLGSVGYTLTGGHDYGPTDGYDTDLTNIISAYETFKNPAEYSLDFIISGPSSGSSLFESQAKASALISLAEGRKDCVVTISPHKSTVVNIPSSDTQTQNIIEFFDSLGSSSYAVFDSGYKYTYDRFNSKFIYLACNADTAGIMARTGSNNYPWFSPAGTARGTLNNAVKLAYNPSQYQRDALYIKRVNPIIASPGQGIILFGDKTALSYSSAFDRINVRRLFLTVEKAIEKASRSLLFEFNDEITRNSFINLVEPYLRDIKSKRGITDFLVVCDESNNTPDIIDSNQFIADIFIKPSRSINFVGLTFVATRTGVSFSEVVGTV